MGSPAPLAEVQTDFTDIGTIPAELGGKGLHAVGACLFEDVGSRQVPYVEIRSNFHAQTRVCGIIRALGLVNFLFDASQTPHIAANQIWEHFEPSSSTIQAKSKQTRDLLGMYPLDPDWSTPAMVDQNPLIWMLEVNGMIIDVRHVSRESQEAAFCQGLIPYIPET